MAVNGFKPSKDEFIKFHYPSEQSVVVVPDGTTCIEMARKVAEENRHKKDWDESFFVCDVGWILDQYKRWKRELPSVDVYYAVKANSLQPVISTLAALGCGFDCASKNEIAMVMNQGVTEDQIIFSHPCKFTSHILFAKEKGVDTMTFDTEEEIYKLKECFPSARLVLRLQVEDNGARTKFGDKFGAPMKYAKHLVKKAKELNMHVVGVSFHVGSGCPSIESFANAIENSRCIFDFASELGYNFELLDIGGGFPGSAEEESYASFEKMATVIKQSLDVNFPTESGVKIIAEPGRYFPGAAYSLVTNVIGSKITKDMISYHVGDGVYNSFSNVLMEFAEFQPTPLKISEGKPRPTTIYGVSCDGKDVIRRSAMMPKVEINEWIYWKEMGSYSAFTQFGFNGFTTYKACHFKTASKMSELQSSSIFPCVLPTFRVDME